MIVRSYSIRLLSLSRRSRGYRPHLTPLARGWGVTGSTGYALATEIPVLHAASDLDLLIRAPQPLDREALLLEWQTRWPNSHAALIPCRNAVRRLRP